MPTEISSPIQGSLVAIVTPMHADGALDLEALKKLIDWHVVSGTAAIVIVGTTGESPTVDVDEHALLIKTTVEHAAGRIKVIAGTGANSTKEAISLAAYAKSVGADASLSVVPYYNKPTQEGLYRHYRAIAEAVPIPQILYNVPGRTACDMKPETVARLADIPNIVGLKEASGSLERNRELIARCAGRIDLYSGDDDLGCASILAGFRGVISVTANVAPRAMHEMCKAALAGDAASAEAINADLTGLHKQLFIESNPIPAKWALQRLGLIPSGIRLPLTPLSESCHEAVLDAMRQAHVL